MPKKGKTQESGDALGTSSKEFLKTLKTLEDSLHQAEDQDLLLDEQLASALDQLDATTGELANRHRVCDELRARTWDLEGKAVASQAPNLSPDGQQLATMLMSNAMHAYLEARRQESRRGSAIMDDRSADNDVNIMELAASTVNRSGYINNSSKLRHMQDTRSALERHNDLVNAIEDVLVEIGASLMETTPTRKLQDVGNDSGPTTALSLRGALATMENGKGLLKSRCVTIVYTSDMMASFRVGKSTKFHDLESDARKYFSIEKDTRFVLMDNLGVISTPSANVGEQFDRQYGRNNWGRSSGGLRRRQTLSRARGAGRVNYNSDESSGDITPDSASDSENDDRMGDTTNSDSAAIHSLGEVKLFVKLAGDSEHRFEDLQYFRPVIYHRATASNRGSQRSAFAPEGLFGRRGDIFYGDL